MFCYKDKLKQDIMKSISFGKSNIQKHMTYSSTQSLYKFRISHRRFCISSHSRYIHLDILSHKLFR